MGGSITLPPMRLSYRLPFRSRPHPVCSTPSRYITTVIHAVPGQLLALLCLSGSMRGSSNQFLISSISALSVLHFAFPSPITFGTMSLPFSSMHFPCSASQFDLNSFPALFGILLNFALPVLFHAIGIHANPSTILYSLANRVTAVLDLSLPAPILESTPHLSLPLQLCSVIILSNPCFSLSDQPLSDPYNAFPYPLSSHPVHDFPPLYTCPLLLTESAGFRSNHQLSISRDHPSNQLPIISIRCDAYPV